MTASKVSPRQIGQNADLDIGAKDYITSGKYYLTTKSPLALADWLYQKKLTIAIHYFTGTVTNGRLHFKFSNDTDIGAHAKSNGYDIRFIAADGVTVLPYERVYYSLNGQYGSGEFYIKVPSVTYASGALIYMLYGNAAATDGSSASATWQSDFARVYHTYNAGTSNINFIDSANGYTLSYTNISNGNGWYFNTAAYATGVQTGLPAGNAPRSIQWVSYSDYSTETLFEYGSGSSTVGIKSSNGSYLIYVNGVLKYTTSQAAYSYLFFTLTFDGTQTWALYRNGSLLTTFTAVPNTTLGTNFHIGDNLAGNSKFWGYVTHFAIANYCKTSDEQSFDFVNWNYQNYGMTVDFERQSNDSFLKRTSSGVELWDMGIRVAILNKDKTIIPTLQLTVATANALLKLDYQNNIAAASAGSDYELPFYALYSISRSGQYIYLVNDVSSPSPNYVYGTDQFGVRGWVPQTGGISDIDGGMANSVYGAITASPIDGGAA